jgi:hypothetical protein
MWIVPLLVRTGAGLGLTYTVFMLWMAAGLIGVFGLAMMIYGGLQVARGGDRPLKHWPALRRIFRR